MLEIQTMEALGNEFIVVDAVSQSINPDEEPKIIKKCLEQFNFDQLLLICLLYTSPSPRDRTRSRMPSSA